MTTETPTKTFPAPYEASTNSRNLAMLSHLSAFVAFDLDENQQTERILQAMASPAVNAIGHLSSRYIGRRPGIELDLDAVMEAAAATGTAIEINGALDRLDATPEAIRTGIELGVTFVIDTHSHHTVEGVCMEYRVLNAQRGWVDKKMVANTWPRARFLKWSLSKRGG